MNRNARTIRVLATALGGTLLALAAPAAPPPGIATRDSFRIGNAGVVCTAQLHPLDAVVTGMFDRGYAVVCSDAAAAVGTLYALRADKVDPLPRVAKARGSDLACAAPEKADIKGFGATERTECTSSATKVKYATYSVARGNTVYVADGLAGYDSALRLGLQTLVADRPVPGEVEVATTSAGDPAAFARVQAGALDADRALAEAYLRNNAGSYAESAEFFEALSQRGGAAPSNLRAAEYLVNEGLQQSNLGNFPTAAALFGQAERRGAASDPVVGRLLRNFRAADLLNQRRPAEALDTLAKPVAAIGSENADTGLAQGFISMNLADQINRENASLDRLGGVDSRLRPYERAKILDGQAQQLRGIALRLQGALDPALSSLEAADRTLMSVRDGHVTTTAFLRSESFSEMGLISEAKGDLGGAERNFTTSTGVLAVDYPQSAALLAAQARLAAFLGRHGQEDRALALYAQVVEQSAQLPGSAATMRNLLAPYFALLAPRTASDPKAAAAMFAATQIMVRPGVAQTQAVLARELSGGDDEASALFRESVTRSRDIARQSGEVARLAAANPAEKSPEATALAAARAKLTGMEADQTALQSRLGAYPRYRVLAPQALTLEGLQKALRPGEAYYQLRIIGPDAYAMFITPTTARAIKVGASTKQLEDGVAKLRASIVTIENGQTATYPFDLALSRQLYKAMFDGFGDPLNGVTHLIYEPDGPLLQLPANLLATEQAGVDAYFARLKKPGADDYDFTGIAWLGRDRDVSTAVSPRSFVDVRAVAPSRGKLAYLGLGQNARPDVLGGFLAASAPAARDECAWPLAAWEHPIQATELIQASQIIGGNRSQVITGAAFSDTAIKDMPNLADYRVIHFATHGLVTAPRPECPARPALLTSFGPDGSDGLLTFKEVYDLHLDADVVVLSACDTAGMATVDATREAGITTGGNFALDGLVRAFVGAGARSVIASHWPVPDDYGATKRLILGLFNAPPGTPMATALRTAQRGLMDQAATSHPYYWSAFAIVGDGERPILRKE